MTTAPTPPTAPVSTRLKLVVVPHTHWDREWHLPFERFRMQLVRLVDELLAIFATDPAYSHFMLDGQTVVLEDYLAIRPEREGTLRELISAGKIAVGPWYVLPDEFLVGGEALVRNLQIGIGIARRFGRPMAIGYLPDSFGHVAQMPQIFRGFGFDAACLWRGVGDDNPGCEWHWEALDGSRVYVQWLSGGYGNFQNLPADEAEANTRLVREVERLSGHASARTLLLMNGSDHLRAQALLPRHIEAFNALNPAWDVVQAGLAEAIAGARAEAGELSVVRGELRGAADTSLLPGVLSARTYLKQANVAAEALLARWVEPFGAIAAATRKLPYDAALVRHAWKTLLQNHPHDSICGCSVDEVHAEMMTRFASVGQLGGALRDEALASLQQETAGPDEAHVGLGLFNPHPWGQLAAVEAELSLDCDADDEPVFALLDEEGLPVPHEVLGLARGVRAVDDPPGTRHNVPTARVQVRLAASLPPLGHRTFKLSRSPMAATRDPELVAAQGVIENRYFRVSVVDGGVEIRDKGLGEAVVHRFEDRGDRGDEYNFCPVEGEPVRVSRDLRWEHVKTVQAGGAVRLELAGTWRLPAALGADRRARVGETGVGIALDVTLHAGVRRVEFRANIDNTARDHRLRAAFQLPDAGELSHATADTAFGWVRREARIPARDWAEQPMGTFPMRAQALVERPRGTGGAATRGLHEYEVVGDALCLTLLRCVSWLSRDDLSTRKGDAGPMLETPGAQCQGAHTFHYAWVSQDATEPEGMVWRRGEEFVVPPRALPLAAWHGHRADAWVTLDEPAWQFSALKPSENGTRLLLRVYNGSAQERPGTLGFGFPVRSVARARLDELPVETLAHDGQAVTLTLRGGEIATLLVEPDAALPMVGIR